MEVNPNTKARLFPDKCWFEKHSDIQRHALIQQLEYWRRTLTQKEFQVLTKYSRGVGPVYHFGQLPLDSVLAAYYDLTEEAATLPVSDFQNHLVRQAERNKLNITFMVVSRKEAANGHYSWHAYIEFDKHVGINPYTFELPGNWRPKSQQFWPVWRRDRAIESVKDKAKEVKQLSEGTIRLAMVPSLETFPHFGQYDQIYPPTFGIHSISNPREGSRYQLKKPQPELPRFQPPSKKEFEEDDERDERPVSDEQIMERTERLLRRGDPRQLPEDILKKDLIEINKAIRTLKRFKHKQELVSELSKRAREMVRFQSKKH